MEYEKMMFFPNATQMSQSHVLTPPSSFKLGESVTNQYLPVIEQYAAYADNFDLSLLPQDNIPTTVSQYNSSHSDNSDNANIDQNTHSNSNNHINIQPPQIKIEQTWCNLALDAVKQEQDYLNSCEQPHPQPQPQQLQQQQLLQQQQQLNYTKTPNQLIPPPPAYPHSYPSPQSSPAQSDYSATFACAQFNGCYDSLSSSRTSLYASSPCPSIDTTCIKQELHILPPSPPESNCETPSPRSACSDSIKAEPYDADVERLVDLNTLLEKSYATQQVPGSGTSKPAHPQQEQQQQPLAQDPQQQDHHLLREYLADNTFQKKHNLKPLALESFIGGLAEAPGDFEPVISLALEHAKREADATCAELQISSDPNVWTPPQVHAWLRSTIAQFELSPCIDLAAKFCENGAALIQLSEEEFIRRLPESGSILHAQLEIWKLAYADAYPQHQQQQQPQQCSTTTASTTAMNNNTSSNNNNNNNNNSHNDNQISDVTMHMQQEILQYQQQQLWQSNYLQNMRDWQEHSEDEDEQMPATQTQTQAHTEVPTVSASEAVASAPATPATTATTGSTSTPTQPVKRSGGARNGGSHIHLWQFLKELLAAPHLNGTAIRWIDRSKGIFKIEDSVRVAKLWGRRKNRPAMNYDKLSRSIRQYYKKGIMKKTERSQRLVYQFCHPYHQ